LEVVEHDNVAAVLEDLAHGNRTTVIKTERATDLDATALERAKQHAIEMYPVE